MSACSRVSACRACRVVGLRSRATGVACPIARITPPHDRRHLAPDAVGSTLPRDRRRMSNSPDRITPLHDRRHLAPSAVGSTLPRDRRRITPKPGFGSRPRMTGVTLPKRGRVHAPVWPYQLGVVQRRSRRSVTLPAWGYATPVARERIYHADTPIRRHADTFPLTARRVTRAQIDSTLQIRRRSPRGVAESTHRSCRAQKIRRFRSHAGSTRRGHHGSRHKSR